MNLHYLTPRNSSHASRCGFSLAEMVIVVAIIGVLAAVAVIGMRVTTSGSKKVVATNLKETLNTAIHRFNSANYELILAPIAQSGTDELSVVRTLQYKNPASFKPGAPYIRRNWNPVVSNDTKFYRLQWSGTLFSLLDEGVAGYGLKVDMEGGDLGTPYVFPSNFTMAGQ
jgi:prepilin-type N-terminal cleavage/methylation domain-containing protein